MCVSTMTLDELTRKAWEIFVFVADPNQELFFEVKTDTTDTNCIEVLINIRVDEVCYNPQSVEVFKVWAEEMMERLRLYYQVYVPFEVQAYLGIYYFHEVYYW